MYSVVWASPENETARCRFRLAAQAASASAAIRDTGERPSWRGCEDAAHTECVAELTFTDSFGSSAIRAELIVCCLELEADYVFRVSVFDSDCLKSRILPLKSHLSCDP